MDFDLYWYYKKGSLQNIATILCCSISKVMNFDLVSKDILSKDTEIYLDGIARKWA